MKYMVVNDRTPRTTGMNLYCAFCCGKITNKDSYVRDLELNLLYCRVECLTDHTTSSQLAIEHHARKVS